MKFIKIEDHSSFYSVAYFMNTYFISSSYLFTTYHRISIFEIADPYVLCFY
jgi:hypothetical protein